MITIWCLLLNILMYPSSCQHYKQTSSYSYNENAVLWCTVTVVTSIKILVCC